MNQLTSRMMFAGVFSTLCLIVGCVGSQDKPLHYLGEASLQYYKDQATQIDYPISDEGVAEEVKLTERPRTIRDREKDDIWNITLQEALHIAIENSKVIRSTQILGQQGVAASNQLLSSPDNVSSVYDPAIQETGVLFFGRGVESALAAFDANFTTSMTWGRDNRPTNTAGAGGASSISETGQFRSEIEKIFAHGGVVSVYHDWDYLGNSGGLFPSTYSGSSGAGGFRSGAIGAEYRLPLLAGAGTEFTRIAGPIVTSFGGLSGVSQGVAIARINNDITIADFEASVRNLINDVEHAYWNLYLQYRLYDTSVTARNSALRTWREAEAKRVIGGVEGFKPADEAQARAQYYASRAATEQTLSNIYSTEVQLRRLLGLPVNDGRIMRPTDEPSTALWYPQWESCITEALTLRPEIRRQKWNIKSLQMQLKAARSLVRPRVDFVSGYRVHALGDRLFGETGEDGFSSVGFNSAYENLTQGEYTGWSLGIEVDIPIGYRQAHAQVRNVQLRVAKARAALAAQELDLSHQLAQAFQNVAMQHATAQSHFNRVKAARRRVDLSEAELKVGTATLDLVLRAQSDLALAERDYYTAVVNYNNAIADLHFQKGTTLSHNAVYLSEGPWDAQAYKDALRRAWARSHAFDAKGTEAEPREYVQPVFSNHLQMYSARADDQLQSESEEQHFVNQSVTGEPPQGTVYGPNFDRPMEAASSSEDTTSSADGEIAGQMPSLVAPAEYSPSWSPKQKTDD